MPVETKPSNANPAPLSPDQRVDEAVEDTFPASDPATLGSLQGARAVAPDEMMHATGAKPAPHADGVTVSHRFRDVAAAKLALEALVREGPIDRRCAELVTEGAAASVRVKVPREDADRLGGLLRRQGGETG